MRVIHNNLIPFPGFYAINLFGILFVRGPKEPSGVTLNHEKIHTAQMKELGYIGFYLIYLLEWAIRLFLPGDAYRGISFEREAYQHQGNLRYLEFRKPYGMWRI